MTERTLTPGVPTAATDVQLPGTKRLAAFALASLGLVVVQRSTIRALLPAGETKQRGNVARERWHLGDRKSLKKNRTSIAFGHALQEFEAHGWLQRTPDTVIVRDPQALLDYAAAHQPAVTPGHLNVKGALRAVRDDLRQTRDTATWEQNEQRYDEIQGLLYLLPATSRIPA